MLLVQEALTTTQTVCPLYANALNASLYSESLIHGQYCLLFVPPSEILYCQSSHLYIILGSFVVVQPYVGGTVGSVVNCKAKHPRLKIELGWVTSQDNTIAKMHIAHL
jgi:hypothetical protein